MKRGPLKGSSTNAAGPAALGDRILVWGNSCSGKSTLARQIADQKDLPLVELDALNWQPNWVGLNATDPERLEKVIREATAGDRWVVAGSYTEQSQPAFWDRLETIIWLDLRMPTLLRRVIKRSWQRHRSRELLWGTNYENFWQQLMVWKQEDSLIWWIATQHHRKRRKSLQYVTDSRWRKIRFIRLRSVAEVDAFVRLLESKRQA
jgi:adenylate kinase family enzyme